jgi:hypothetical protein
VIVAGSSITAGSLRSVELLYLREYEESQEGFVMGQSLPDSILTTFGSTVSFQNSVIYTGNSPAPRHLYHLTSPNGPWTEMKQIIRQQRGPHVAFLVPDELVNCH